jgi:hypothetical protein
MASGVIDTTDNKKTDFKVEFVSEFESIFETALTRGSGAQIGCLMKKPNVENLVTRNL